MSRRASIFDRLALKERVAINQQMKSLGALSNEFRQIDEMRRKLDEMARDQAPSDGVQNAGSLRAAAQLNFQIRVQLETASNRSEHLAEELRHMRQRIAVGVISHGKTQPSKNPNGASEMASELHHLSDEFYPTSISGLFTNVRNFV